MYLYDYKNRMIGVRPERWNQTWNAGTTTPQPGYVCVENGEFSIYSANNVSNTIVEREIPTVSFRDDVPFPDTELSFDFDKVASVDANRFYFYFMNSETGAFLRVHYYGRSHRIDVHQYSTTSGYETIYTNTSYYEDDGNCKFVIVDGDILTFYLDGVLKGATALDNDIDDLNAVKILVKEGHFHYDNILVDQIFNTGTTNIVDLDFSDGPYAQFADYYYNTINERILTVKSQEAASYYPFKTNVYDGNGQTLCEYKINKSASYSFLNDYVYGNGKKLARYDGSDIEYYHNNYLGSIQAITDGLGNVVWSRDYYPYGDEKGSGIGSDDANEYKFTGKEWDNESKFFYYWHRYYDPEIGRFVQVDPMWSESINLSSYHYCNNNPLIAIDPDGLSTFVNSSYEVIQNIKDNSSLVYRFDLLQNGEIDFNTGVIIGKTVSSKGLKIGIQIDLLRDAQGEVDAQEYKYIHRLPWGDSPIWAALMYMPYGPMDLKRSLFDEGKAYAYDGYIMEGRDIGNTSAGKTAAKIGMPYSLTIMSAGVLHVLDNLDMQHIFSGYFGEEPQAGRRIKAGYESISK